MGNSQCLINETVLYDKYHILLSCSFFPDNPRVYDSNLTILAVNSDKYNLKSETDNVDFTSRETLKNSIIQRYSPVLVKPLYIYDHGSIKLVTDLGSCTHSQWDSTFVGYIFLPLNVVISNNIREEDYEQTLNQELETFRSYFNGDVYYYELYEFSTCPYCDSKISKLIHESVDFIGSNLIENGLIDDVFETITKHDNSTKYDIEEIKDKLQL